MKTINAISLNDSELNFISGGLTQAEKDTVNTSGYLIGQLGNLFLRIIQELRPSYNWNDVGGNFTSLIHEWTECYLGENGKKLGTPRCRAIEQVLGKAGLSTQFMKEKYAELLK